jgi:hypothetical protein
MYMRHVGFCGVEEQTQDVIPQILDLVQNSRPQVSFKLKTYETLLLGNL